MSLEAALLPLLVQVALTFALLLRLAALRTRALARKEVRPRDIALGQKAWPEALQQIANAFENQFELPVLFYLITVLAVIAHKDDLLFVILAWIFVASRLVHAFIHTGSNIVRLRGAAYGIGMLVLVAMWVIFALEILTS
jgi:hypothetical protein